MTRRVIAPAALLAASALVLAGCAGSATPAASDGGPVQVVASTNVYGDIAAAIGGDHVEVTSIIDSLSQDPHSYEASAKDQLTVSRAGLIIENGGGYDAFLDGLVEATGTEAPVVTAVEYSHDYPDNEGHDDHDHADDDAHTDAADDHGDDHAGHDHIEGFNEHVWYDPHTIAHVAEEIAHELSEIDPANAADYQAGYETFAAGVADLESSLEQLATAHAGAKIFVTEPVPLYLTAAAGLANVTPDAFSEAVEEGQDVPPATLLEALNLLAAGDVSTVIVNAQTGGAETTEVTTAAEDAGIPVLEFTELIPDGETYLTWMQANIADLAGTLTR
ncbi:zinc ABC transporter substrate-binding protein [Microbacterium sp. W1N]|uniref:metal ABC transporter solute-binding protein, Zn/Mn family n=1 Tax=Microbacterium festucae TaxID=2977531 RepID=UPI0021BE268C|nr:zinc ABC transporter substrate-binding protein [Microbacterium festucae]MCT9819544.1 zinc ABC transporter substrate-binding protein [Microbacterium festucae]